MRVRTVKRGYTWVMTPPTRSTRMFARVLGPYFVIVAVTATLRAAEMRELLADFGANPLWPWVMGALVLIIGLTVVALHPHWNNPAAVIVSVLGWAMVLRGVFLLAFPAAFMSAADAVIGSGKVWQIGYLAMAVLGLYLSYAGWRPTPAR